MNHSSAAASFALALAAVRLASGPLAHSPDASAIALPLPAKAAAMSLSTSLWPPGAPPPPAATPSSVTLDLGACVLPGGAFASSR